MYTKLSDLKTALINRGILTKTQLRFTQKAFNIDNKVLADLFGIKPNSLNALKSYSPGSGNYNMANLDVIRDYVKGMNLIPFANEINDHGMILTYSNESWDTRIRSGLKFDNLATFETALCQFLLQDSHIDFLDIRHSVVISTKELSNLMYVPEDQVTSILDQEEVLPQTEEKQANLFDEFE